MIKENTRYTKGDIIVVTEGSYSDYGIVDLVEVLQDFDSCDFRRGSSSYNQKIDFNEIVRKELVKPIFYREMWMGS